MNIKQEICRVKFDDLGINPQDLEIFYEKSGESSYLKDSEYKVENLNFLNDSNDPKNQNFLNKILKIQNGDVFIAELKPKMITNDYIDAKKYMDEIFVNITIQCVHHNKYEKFGYESFASKVLKTGGFSRDFKVSTKLFYTYREFMTQVAGMLSNDIEYTQIQLYSQEANFIIPVAIKNIEENNGITDNRRLSFLISKNNSILFDILPYKASLLEKQLLVYTIQVDENFNRVSQFHKLLEKYATVKDLDDSLDKEMTKILSENTLKVSYYLLNHPQNAIIKELSLNQRLDEFCSNHHYLICFRPVNKKEYEFSENKVTNIQKKVPIYIYNKGSEQGASQICYFHEEVTCKELSQCLISQFEEKAKVMICSIIKHPDKHEIKPQRQLEESDTKFFEKYSDKQVGIELPGTNYNKNELKIN